MTHIPPDTIVILRHGKLLDYVTWTGEAWQLLRLDIALGTCRTGPSFESFIEAARAYRAGIRWED